MRPYTFRFTCASNLVLQGLQLSRYEGIEHDGRLHALVPQPGGHEHEVDVHVQRRQLLARTALPQRLRLFGRVLPSLRAQLIRTAVTSRARAAAATTATHRHRVPRPLCRVGNNGLARQILLQARIWRSQILARILRTPWILELDSARILT